MMKKLSKKLLSVLLCIAMIAAIVPSGVFSVFAEESSAPKTIEVATKAELDAAILSANDGDTIKLIDNITLTEGITIEKNASITIDFNGKKITGTVAKETTALLNVTGGCNLVLKDSSGDMSGGLYAERTPDGGLKNLIRVEADATLVIENGNYYQDKSTNGCGMIDSRGDEIITVNGGNFKLDNIGTADNGSPWVFNTSGQNTKNIIVNGGTFNTDINHQYYPFEVTVPEEKAVKKNGDGTWTMVDAVAYVAEKEKSGNWYTHPVGYATFKEAYDAATIDASVNTGVKEEITLLKDIEIKDELVIDDNDIINMNGNKFVISDLNATVQASDKHDLTITTNIFGYKVKYSEGDYMVAEITKEAAIGNVQYDTFEGALDVANAAEDGSTIKLLKHITVGKKLTINKNITISGSGEATITRDAAYTGTLFDVNAGATLTLDGGLTIDGNNEYVFNAELYAQDLANCETAVPSGDNTKWFTPEEGAPVATEYMIITSGTLNLNDVTIKNHYSTNGSGIVSASKDAVVTLDGAQITHNASTNGSGLVVSASAGVYSLEEELITVTMNEGTVIDDNHVGGNNGIFKIHMGTYFTMNGGEIKNTTGWNSNGTAIGIYYGVFTMNGGTICSNSSVYGPDNGRNAAVYGNSNYKFTMNGGTICHNSGNVTITFNTNGGSYVPPITQAFGTEITAPVAPTKEGYTFIGWDTEIPSTMPAENITITAIWKANTATVTFNTNGGSEVAPITQNIGSAVTAPEAPTKAGYVFDDWYLDGEVFELDGYILDGDLELEARYHVDKNNNGINDAVDPAYTDSFDDMFRRLINAFGSLVTIVLMSIFVPVFLAALLG